MEPSPFPDPPARWERLSTQRLADYEIFSVRLDRSRSPRTGEVHGFNIVESENGATVIALTPDGELVMVEQYRHPRRRLSVEIPIGLLDEGESLEEAGLRELREETGYVGDTVEVLGTLDVNPSWSTTTVGVVLVRDARLEGEKEQDAGEDVRVHLVEMERVRAMVRDGTLASATVVAALCLFWSREDAGAANEMAK